MKVFQLNLFHGVLKTMAPSFYAVAKGHKPGVYTTWDECKVQVHQYSGPVFKKFSSKTEAEDFIKIHKSLSERSKSTNTIPALRKRTKSQVEGSSQDGDKPPSKRRILLLDLMNSNTNTVQSPQKESSSNYIVDKFGYVNVYTDGACSSNGMKNPRAGIGVWFGDGHPLNVSEPLVGRATNNRAEIRAVTVAAQQAKRAGIKKLKINTDSMFLLHCIQEWMPKWKTNGWKTTANKPVINKEELIEMEEALNSLNVSWNHVRGHGGIHGNEMADKLARAGSLQYSSQ